MHCKKCGKKLRENEMFCTVCGYYNSRDDNDENIEEEEIEDEKLLMKQNPSLLEKKETREELEEYNEFSLSPNNSRTHDDDDDFYTYEDERLVEAYIGEDYKIIKKSFFNIYALLLSWMYVLYRKMYILGILGLVGLGIIISINKILIIIYVVTSMIILGLCFNKIYIFFSSKKISFIKKKNAETDKFTLEEICAKKGGTNFVIALIIYLIFLIVIFITNFGFKLNQNQNSQFWKENSENKATCISMAKTAYKDIGIGEITGELVDAVCIIDSEEFNLYLKVKDNMEINYLSYKTEKGYLILEDSTKGLSELQAKEANKTLTVEEKKFLEKKRNIENSYYEATKTSKIEDAQIEENKNTNKKSSFIIKKDEILR